MNETKTCKDLKIVYRMQWNNFPI